MRAELPTLPEVMARSAAAPASTRRGSCRSSRRRCSRRRVGDTFEAIVVDLSERRGGGVVAIREPAVTARCTGDDLPLGGRIDVRLQTADVMQRLVRFEPA